MPRARNIKYAFFENDELAELDPLCRLFFIGLWTIADWKGNLLWREKKLKSQILPYDECSINEYGINLSKARFIRFYADHQNLYCNVINFTAHQNPHVNEKKKKLKIPEYCETMAQAVDLTTLAILTEKIGPKTDKVRPTRADSLSLKPDSLECHHHCDGDFITKDWQPDNETRAMLKQTNGVPDQFINMERDEFVTYWSARKKPADSWDSKFMKSCASQWIKYGHDWKNGEQKEFEAKGFIERHTDQSWREGL